MLEYIIGLVGIALILNGIAAISSLKYYSKLSSVFFIEPISSASKNKIMTDIEADHFKSRYLISAFCIFFGTTIFLWAIGIKSALGWPFTIIF